ncbi:hypothetical protein F0562_026859 [Nyssa sinensis]|uniref:Rhodanese domain-containing protein n=1 Tax=Nyssa sinensis TaxID=561372 RepID=A0A5J5B4J9_9ASTE|nr:hypothetical protein F0562_026859 [Nyssa sinensis]
MARRFFASSAGLMLPLALRQQSRNVRHSSATATTLQSGLRHLNIDSARNTVSNFGSMTDAGKKSEPINEPRSVAVNVALELQQAGHRYLDVRTYDEFNFGHALGAMNIPYMFKTGAGMSKNPKFLEEVSSHFEKDDEIIIGCQSGKRSLMAAADLLSAGFTSVTNVAGGYSAWADNGLPTDK